MKLRSLLISFALIVAGAAQAATEIQFWHAMDGARAEQLDWLVESFNSSQRDFKVVASSKGSYDETLAAAREAASQGKAPHIVQLADAAIMNAMLDKRLMKPVYQLMAESREPLDPKSFLPAIASFHADAKGHLLALPFNLETPVFYYNKDAFKEAGLDENKAFKTWYEVQEAGLKLYEAQATPCVLTTTYPSRVMLENVLGWHNEEFATRNNGFDGTGAQLSFNTFLAMRHMSLLTTWITARIFTYSGRGDEGEKKFIGGECAMLTDSSSAYADIARAAKFRLGVMPMPYYDDFKGAPYHTTLSGGSLWALAGKSATENRGVAKFFAYFVRPEVQAEWHQRTAYLPVTRAAFELTRKLGFYDKHPGSDLSVAQIIGKSAPASYARGVRLRDYQLVRAVIDEEIEQIWEGKKPPKAGLDDAVRRGNELLKRSERTPTKP